MTDGFHLHFFLLYSLPRLSAVSVVFDFNDSLNDVAPKSPTLLSVCFKTKKKLPHKLDTVNIPLSEKA